MNNLFDGACMYNPKIEVDLKYKVKERNAFEVLFSSADIPRMHPLKDNPANKSFDSIFLSKTPAIKVQNPMFYSEKQRDAISLIKLITISEESIEHKFNLKLVYDIMRDFYLFMRCILIKSIRIHDPQYFSAVMTSRNSEFFEKYDLSKKRDKHIQALIFLSQYYDLYKFLPSAISILDRFGEAERKVVRDSIQTIIFEKKQTYNIIINDYFQYEEPIFAPSVQVDNLLTRPGMRRVVSPHDYAHMLNAKIFDVNYRERYLNLSETKYDYKEMFLKQSYPVYGRHIEAIDSTKQFLTPYNRFSNFIYLFDEKSKKDYQTIMLKCIIDDPGKFLFIDQYLAKCAKSIKKLHNDVTRLMIALSALRNKNKKDLKEIIHPEFMKYKQESDGSQSVVCMTFVVYLLSLTKK
jgi:hypothetical protein